MSKESQTEVVVQPNGADVNPFILNKRCTEHGRVLARHRREVRFRAYGIAALTTAGLFLALLLVTIVSQGSSAFFQTKIQLDIHFDEAVIDRKNSGDPDIWKKANYSKLIHTALKSRFPEAKSRSERKLLYGMISRGATGQLRTALQEDKSLLGKTKSIWLYASSDIDMAEKGKITQDGDETSRRVRDIQFSWIEELRQKGQIETGFNVLFLTAGDSREPELAGIWGSVSGSLLTLFVCILCAFPVGVGAAVYLEEFAAKNKWSDIIEVNLNNLAAVPSIVYGVLGLAVFLGAFNMPRSSAIVGGMTLALLVLPTIVITTRNSLKSVPPSIRDAAIGLGASPIQVLLHHTLPLAMPGIMTGAILSIARALGETAPLLMIGMVAFIADVPRSLSDPATALPVQVYLWADSPELGFAEKTSAAIMVLLGFLIIANALAVYLRRKFEYKW